MISVSTVDHPELAIVQCFQSLKEGESRCLGLKFSFQQYDLPEQPGILLLALVRVVNEAGQMHLSASVGEFSDQRQASLHNIQSKEELLAWCGREAMPWFEAGLPLLLESVAIPKPWGQEIWYTGIEARGQSGVSAQGFSVPLPWLLAIAPQYWVVGKHHSLNLLKILDPLPEQVYGDLYFELHEEKQEVYVVTHIDDTAWPNAQGGIRFGFDSQKRAEYSSAEAFKQAYLDSVEDYQQVRIEVDQQVDQLRLRDGVALDEPVSAARQKEWLQSISPDLLLKEQGKRQHMDSFVAVKPLGLGDVVKVPCYTPHSLMHGVRTVEFQTPVYERKILSFAQKVLTQSHWDTRSAVEIMALDNPEEAPLKQVHSELGVSVEEIVDFDDFSVLRLTLQPGASYSLAGRNDYALVMSLTAGVEVNATSLKAEEALLLPNGLVASVENSKASKEAIVLVSLPKDEPVDVVQV